MFLSNLIKSNKILNLAQTKCENIQLKYYRWKGGQIANFLHISKTGGSAIKHTLADYLQTDNFIIHLRGHDCKLRDIPQGDKFFFCLRDPIARFASAFYFKKRQTRPWKHSKFETERKILQSFKTPEDLAIALSTNDPVLRNLAVEGMTSIEHINTSYLDWFESESYFLSRFHDCLYVAFQESLDRDFECLKQILGLPQDLYITQNSNKAKINPQHGNQSSKTYQFSQAATYNLKQWYARDYDFFNLCQSQAQKRKIGSSEIAV
ncbi:sulfotransferase family 2 domain-containing protein [Baaleninema simplex]|uniref:sulfotransferase family 2 domain-containing protein n=1 Tax=Baaleninema simplex TaxID=2862350 RepID=UPI0003605EF8|nr:sulfotransferase family 2 domain-containing protein [Baaleninema simplex]